MNQNAKKWVAALESGDYEQTDGVLKSKSGFEYCCLGVACEVYRQETGLGRWTEEHRFSASAEDARTATLPNRVMEWLGINDAYGTYDDGYKSLTDHNDHDKFTFKEIAEIIKSEPKGLFS